MQTFDGYADGLWIKSLVTEESVNYLSPLLASAERQQLPFSYRDGAGGVHVHNRGRDMAMATA